MNNKSKIISMDVDVTNLEHAVENIILLSHTNHSSYICVSNVHMCMETFDSETFSQVVNAADLVIPDGRL
jgi:N-acetylglucosaminyldiphosphoundecaprenol N-acetyl-beta-D-mannosaminyltransferase